MRTRVSSAAVMGGSTSTACTSATISQGQTEACPDPAKQIDHVAAQSPNKPAHSRDQCGPRHGGGFARKRRGGVTWPRRPAVPRACHGESRLRPVAAPPQTVTQSASSCRSGPSSSLAFWNRNIEPASRAVTVTASGALERLVPITAKLFRNCSAPKRQGQSTEHPGISITNRPAPVENRPSHPFLVRFAAKGRMGKDDGANALARSGEAENSLLSHDNPARFDPRPALKFRNVII